MRIAIYYGKLPSIYSIDSACFSGNGLLFVTNGGSEILVQRRNLGFVDKSESERILNELLTKGYFSFKDDGTWDIDFN